MVAAVLSRPLARRPFQPFGHARTAWKSARRECLLAGPAGTGKSRALIEKLHYCADKYPGMRALMVRKTRKSLTQTALVTYEKKVLPDKWLGTLIHFRTNEQEYRYPNGSILALGGMDDPDKVMSSEWDMIYVQEATELSEADWEALTTRLRNGVMPYQQLIADCNPASPTHWLKRRCDRGVTQMLESRHEDNPAITQEYLDTLDALTGVRYLRLRLGKWAAAEGVVFEEWDRNVHLVSKQQLIDWNVFYENGQVNRAKCPHVVAGVDWGFTNPGVINVNAVDTDGRLYLLHEVYRTRKTIDWWLDQAERLTHEYGIEQFICDPAEPAYIAQFNARGLPAIGAFNDIAPGINFMRSRLRPAGDGRARLYVYEYALQDRDEALEQAHKPTCFEQEIDAYVWQQSKDGKPVKEEPVDDANHSLDAERYVASYYDANPYEIGVLDDQTAQTIRGFVGY